MGSSIDENRTKQKGIEHIIKIASKENDVVFALFMGLYRASSPKFREKVYWC